MNFLCCCCRKSILKKEDNSRFVKYNDVNNILKIKRTISNLSENSESKSSDFSSDTISDCSNSSLNDYIIALDSVITRQEYMNHRPPVCTHIIETLIFNQNLL